ncbi:DUF6470 family protein [Salimicrobium halophilum]|uniref:Uncharacterized protein n=1 Tax=Salimicrobium halophilum TaxID=86666 RepID=A0A1G8RZA0_9BACI|nr:DUF6470 family protein [Salimicrobium halophilum]SDJ22334.1 hypothetical protein SAMN04490247_1173 [Salimicrobium halophilum]
MQMPRLQISTTDARVGIQTRNAELTYQQPKAEVSIRQPKADVSIRQPDGELRIDQSKARSNLHLKSSAERSRQTEQFGEQKAMEGSARRAREGDELMRIENGGNLIASQAKRNYGYEIDYQMGNTPVHELVNIDYTAREAEINIQKNDPQINITPRYPQYSYQPGGVNISLLQEPSITIDWKV